MGSKINWDKCGREGHKSSDFRKVANNVVVENEESMMGNNEDDGIYDECVAAF